MLSWLLAIAAGVAAAFYTYGTRLTGGRGVAAALRGIAVAGCVALLLDVWIGARRTGAPIVALDLSESWGRGRDSAAFAAARRAALQLANDSVVGFGDSLRRATSAARSTDRASRLRPLVEQALASGRAVHLFTDGEVDDPESAAALPSGSQVHLAASTTGADAAIFDVRAPRAVVAGDTVGVEVTISAGAVAVPRARLALSLGDRPARPVDLDSLGAHAERSVRVQLAAPNTAGSVLLRAALTAPGDVERRNDSVTVAVEVSVGAGAVLVSTSPDLDVRELAAVLRGTLSIPTRGFYRIAPGVWREEGTLAAVSEEIVRRSVREAPVLVIHGDTTIFGNPRAISRGALLLFAPPLEPVGEWYATGAPPSPVASALSGSLWDSLPPLEVSSALPTGDAEILETRRGRRLERRVAAVLWERPRRIAVVGASGFYRWRARGGAGAGTFTALWGSLLDWLAVERSDVRAAVPIDGAVRAGTPVRWRRGGAADSIVVAVLTRRGGTRADTVTLRFSVGLSTTETAPLDPGVYDIRVGGGSALLAVNASGEWLPRRVRLADGAIGTGTAQADAPHLRLLGWVFGLVIAALCAEWILRRQLGLR